MITGWRYRILGGVGAALLTLIGVYVANHPVAQVVFTTYVPLFWRLDPVVLTNDSLQLAMLVSAVIVFLALTPLYKPQPRRILDTILLVQQRVLIAGLGLATLGFFKWSHRLPRATLVMLIVFLSLSLPLVFVVIRGESRLGTNRTIIVGDDFKQIEHILNEISIPIQGYLSPSQLHSITGSQKPLPSITDGGQPNIDINRLGGLSRLEEILIEYNISSVILAFSNHDREEFFGTLESCYHLGVTPLIHQEYVDNVLTSDGFGPLLTIDIEPWDTQDYVLKRLFDIVVSAIGLIVLFPVIVLISVAIKLDSSGPVFFQQKRTKQFGGEFTFTKFRTMVPNAEEITGVVVSKEDAGGYDPRITRVGRFLRKTHLDEIPQLWSVLTGEMSIVGPRPAQSELEDTFEDETPEWGKRWFVKPGLTGFAQINDATGHEPERKLFYDLAYIRNQSLRFDILILIRQFWKVGTEVVAYLRRS